MSVLCNFLLVCVMTATICRAEDVTELQISSNSISVEESHAKAQQRLLQTAIKQLVECFRRQLLKGIPQLGISTLDPLKLFILPVILNTRYLSSSMLLRNFQLEGLAGFELTKGKLTIGVGLPLRAIFDFGLKFNKIRVTSRYRGKMNILKMMDVFGKGNVSVEFLDFSIDLRVVMNVVPLKVTQFSLELLLPTTQAKITGLFDDEYMSNIISKQLSDTLTTLAKEEENKINDFLSSTIWSVIIPKINEVLEKIQLEDIIAIITGGASDCESTIFSFIQEIKPLLRNIIDFEGDFLSLKKYGDDIDRNWETDNFFNDI